MLQKNGRLCLCHHLFSRRDPIRAPTELPLLQFHYFLKPQKICQDLDPLPEPAVGIAARIEATDGSTQTPPLLSRLIQSHLEGTGMEPCVRRQLDHGVRDPDCDHCKRRSRVIGSHFDFSGPQSHRVNAAQYLLVCVCVEFGDLVWAFGIENRRSTTVLPCLQSAFEDARSLAGGSRPPILRLHSDNYSS